MPGVQAIESLIRQVEETADPATRAGVAELVQAILEYHGAGLERIVELAGDPLLHQFARDELVGSLLLLYNLHPESFAARVQRAVDAIPYVELAGISDFSVRLKVNPPGHVSREAVEDKIYAAAPEADRIEIEGLASSASFVPLEALLRA
jgi:hypothetical protein